jgi:hypothetical protein
MKEAPARNLCVTGIAVLMFVPLLIFTSPVFQAIGAIIMLLVGHSLAERVLRWLVKK